MEQRHKIVPASIFIHKGCILGVFLWYILHFLVCGRIVHLWYHVAEGSSSILIGSKDRHEILSSRSIISVIKVEELMMSFLFVLISNEVAC